MNYIFIPKHRKDCLFCKYSYADDLYYELRCKLTKDVCPSKITINKKGQQTYRNPICKKFIDDDQI